MIRRLTILTLLCVLSLAVRANDGSEVHDDRFVPEAIQWKEKSPDGKHLAITCFEPDSDMPSRPDLDTGVLEIRELDSGKAGQFVHFQMSRLSAHLAWSPDSKYLVLTTVSAGGHSPWHFKAYAYSVTDRSLRYMDEVIGLVVSPDFSFVGPGKVRMGIGETGDNGVDFEHPTLVIFDLDQKFLAMKVEQRPLTLRSDRK